MKIVSYPRYRPDRLEAGRDCLKKMMSQTRRLFGLSEHGSK